MRVSSAGDVASGGGHGDSAVSGAESGEDFHFAFAQGLHLGLGEFADLVAGEEDVGFGLRGDFVCGGLEGFGGDDDVAGPVVELFCEVSDGGFAVASDGGDDLRCGVARGGVGGGGGFGGGFEGLEGHFLGGRGWVGEGDCIIFPVSFPSGDWERQNDKCPESPPTGGRGVRRSHAPLARGIPDIFIPPTRVDNAGVIRVRNENSGMTMGGSLERVGGAGYNSQL